MNGACLFLGILFLAAGIYFYSGKAVNHITAWKTMPEEEKRKIHIRPLCRNVGMMIATSGIIFLLSGAWYAFRKSGFLWCMVGWMVLSGADVYWIGKSGRYQSSGKEPAAFLTVKEVVLWMLALLEVDRATAPVRLWIDFGGG